MAAPATPANLSIDNTGSNGFVLTWDNVAGEDGFYLYRSTDNFVADSRRVLKTLVDVLKAWDLGLLASTQYYYKISAFNADGESALSAAVNDTTDAQSLKAYWTGSAGPFPYDENALVRDGAGVDTVFGLKSSGQMHVEDVPVFDKHLIRRIDIFDGGSINSPTIEDADQDTQVQCEESSDEDIIRFDADGTQEMQVDVNGVTLKSGASVNEFSTDGALAGDSDDAVPTEKAVKLYVDNHEADTTDIHGIVDTSKLNTSDAVITDHAIVRGDGGAQKIQDSGITVDDNDDLSNARNINMVGADDVTLRILTSSTDNTEVARIWFTHARGVGGDSSSIISQYEFDFKIDADEDFYILTNSNARIKVSGGGVTQIGDGGVTNYAQIAADGEITLVGTARVKKQIAIANANLGKGGTKPTEVIIGNYNAWEYGINDDSVFTFHIPHDWAAGTDIVINIDWYIDEPAGDEIKWQITYSSTPHNSTEVIDSAGTSVDTGDIVIPTTPKFLTQNSLTIPAAVLAMGDQVGVTLKRIAITDGTNPANEPGVVDLHIEYTSDKLGEAT